MVINEPTDLQEGTELTLFVEAVASPELMSPMAEETRYDENEKEPQEKTVESTGSFSSFLLDARLTRVIDELSYTTPTLIQEQAIPPVMKGSDVMGVAKTGSGKTAAFVLPILHNLLQGDLKEKSPQVLVVTPTRELALQVGENFKTFSKFTPLKQVTVFGGVNQFGQVRDLRKRPHVIVATPGRLLDLMQQGHISLDRIHTFVLDEADRMLDMGFINDMNKIFRAIPDGAQTLLFSATMPSEVLQLAKKFLAKGFVHVMGDLQSIPIDKIEQEIYFVEKYDKYDLLHTILDEAEMTKTIIFTRTKHGADKLARRLKKYHSVEALHGNKSQNARQRTLQNFRDNRTQILVATDLAARGLDVEDISHVINFDLPREAETYMHRIGRTARAGKSGKAMSFCSQEEWKYLSRIEALLGLSISRAKDHPFQSSRGEPRNSSRRRSRKKVRQVAWN